MLDDLFKALFLINRKNQKDEEREDALFVQLARIKYRVAERSQYLIVSSIFNSRCCTFSGKGA